MSYKALENLRDTMCTELDNLSKEKTVTTQSLEQIHKLTDIIKNIDKIMYLENGDYGYSPRDEYGGGYDRGNSYDNRGQHWVRGHYSRDGYDDGYSERGNRGGRGYSFRNGGYSREGDIMDMLREMMNGADEREREAIKRCLKELGE